MIRQLHFVSNNQERFRRGFSGSAHLRHVFSRGIQKKSRGLAVVNARYRDLHSEELLPKILDIEMARPGMMGHHRAVENKCEVVAPIQVVAGSAENIVAVVAVADLRNNAADHSNEAAGAVAVAVPCSSCFDRWGNVTDLGGGSAGDVADADVVCAAVAYCRDDGDRRSVVHGDGVAFFHRLRPYALLFQLIYRSAVFE